jgi:hypothetical protein
MKTFLLSSACVMLFAAPALACRGTAEYPETAQLLAESNLSHEQKEEYQKRLEEGATMHRQGHDLNDPALRTESLKILDDIKVQIAK